MSPFLSSKIRQQNNDQPRTRAAELMHFLESSRLRLVLVAASICFGLVYLWLVNSAATAGFYLSDLSKQAVALEKDYHKLELEKTALQSLEHIEERSKELNLVASTGVAYVEGDATVAYSE